MNIYLTALVKCCYLTRLVLGSHISFADEVYDFMSDVATYLTALACFVISHELLKRITNRESETRHQ
jgi:hypothetical protein